MSCLYSNLIISYLWFFPAEYLRGFETFAETSFVIDSHSHTLEWQRYGLKLHIPEAAVVAELRECRVDTKAGFTGQFNIPDDLQLVSCVYWLSCPQKFLKPVTLEIEHCASLQDSSQSSSLRFIVAKCSQAELPTNSEYWRKECLHQGVPMAAFKSPSFQYLALACSEDYGHYSDTTVPCTTFRRTLISGI